jgi:phosphomannomutase
MEALPTRDSVLPILCNLSAAAEQGIALATLWARLPARFGRAGLIDDVPVAISGAILAHLVPAGDVVEVELAAAGRVLVPGRPGGEAERLAGPAAAAWHERGKTLSRFFTPALGFDDIVRINVLDGVRVTFHNGDVAHVRPSGNAPQLRIYANCNTQERADRIVELGLREPDGILRRMEKAFACP